MSRIGSKRTFSMLLAAALILAELPANFSTAQAIAEPAGTPGGVEANLLKLWLKADSASMTVNGNGEVTEWKDSSPQGNHFINDGTVGVNSPRTKPKYVASNPLLNFQPTVQFIRSGSGSLLLDKDGLFGQDEPVQHASAYAVTGGLSVSNQTSQIFYENLQGTGRFGAYIPIYSSNASQIFWDSGAVSSGNPRMSTGYSVPPLQYNSWGFQFESQPAVTGAVYQAITLDGQTIAQSTQPRLAMAGDGSSPMSLGSAVGGGSGYNGQIGEMIVFGDALTGMQHNQVQTYLALKFGTPLKGKDYVSAGTSPQVVWPSAANAAYGHNVAGIVRDQQGALAQSTGRSSEGGTSSQVVISAKQALADKQYLLWGDNGSTAASLPYGTDFKQSARTWKVRNTGDVGTVQVAFPQEMLPLGGLLLTSTSEDFSHAVPHPLSPVELHGAAYYAADAELADGTYFTYAEKMPSIQLSSLEVWADSQKLGMNTPFTPVKMDGYEVIVPADAKPIRLELQADAGISTSVTLTNQEGSNQPVSDVTRVSLAPGMNKLMIRLTSGDSTNTYTLQAYQLSAKGTNGQIRLNGSTVTASSYQPNTTNIPANVVDGVWDNDVRWSASGQGQWLQFDLGQPEQVTYLNIAFLNAIDRQTHFEIVGSNQADFQNSAVLLPKRKSRVLQAGDDIMQPYVLSSPAAVRYLRLVGYGNTATGSSGNWNSITEVELYTGTAPAVEEPAEPEGPPQAGDKPVEPLPPVRIVKVSSANDLQAALDQAVQGTTIELQNGTYQQNGPFVMKNKMGTAALPIRIVAAEQGKAVIAGDSYMHIENSDYVEVEGLTFRSGGGSEYGEDTLRSRAVPDERLTALKGLHPGVELYDSSNVSILRNVFALDETGQRYRFTKNENGVNKPVWCVIGVENSCRYGSEYDPHGAVYTGETPHTPNSTLLTDGGTDRHYIQVEGTSSHNRIAYNDIGPKTGFGAVMTYDGKDAVSQYDVIEYNHFHDIGPRVSNGLEAIRLGLSGLSLAPGHVTVQYNLFDGLNGEDEIVSVKSSDNTIRYNTVLNSYGGIVARHGHRNSFYGNFIMADGKKPGTSGFRIYGNDHKIYNNYMEGLTDDAIQLDGGTEDAGPDGGTNPVIRWGTGANDFAELRSLTPARQQELLRGHWRQYNVQIFNNSIVDLGNKASAVLIDKRTFEPTGTQIYNNVIYSNAGTIFNETKDITSAGRPAYVGNMADGIAAVAANATVVSATYKGDLKLVRGSDGLIRLSPLSPAVDAAQGPYIAADDMDGQRRTHTADAGSDEYEPAAEPGQRPLTAADVGPAAGRSIPETVKPSLSSLQLSANLTVSPAFRSETTYYTVTVPAGVGSLSVTPSSDRAGSAIQVSVDGGALQSVRSGSESGPLAIAASGSVILIDVSLASGVHQTYTIMVQRPPASGSSSSDSASGYYPAPTPAPAPMPNPIPEPDVKQPSKPLESAAPVPSHNSFADVPNHWAAEAISRAAAKGIVNGYSDGSFRPDEPMSRLQFAAMLVRALGLKAEPAELDFADRADIPAWAEGELGAALEAGILQGYEDRSLRPNELINRAEMVTMLIRAYSRAEGRSAATTFSDNSRIPDWALPAVSQAAALGLVSGRANDAFEPFAAATRAEAVTILMRMLER
ncbi:chondroitinase-B domain-containing protein [Paenibacillus sp. GCM10023248]|uniref:chondroitinase-B domain-containing protein n=1 Tax=unclassified Paenibacillus TaxID=185978 RepID=UPI002379F52D|nr:chondroitinase-B domain-containing protein [Paenibacillus sp. MAHUQ-63]MDD9267146.1 chondroitinase-B domain-containing protein [Paenibacillus sp. MAHUQ-63]